MKLEKEDLILMYKNMVRTRKLDELMIAGLQNGKVGSFYHSAQGSEGLAVGVGSSLNKDDYLYAHHRGHGIGYIISKGASALEFIGEHYGKSNGACGGISGFHFVAPEFGAMGCAGTIGSQFPVPLGWGLSCKKNGRGQVAVSCFGDGSSNRGTLHEAFNLASVWKLPIVWVCDNNGVAQYTPIKDAYPKDDIADLAAGYDMPGVVVDGMDILAVYEAMQAAIARARAGDGPSMIEAKTTRFRSHSEGSPDVYHFTPRPPEIVEEWKKRDAILSFSKKLIEQGHMTESDMESFDTEIDAEVAEIDRVCVECPAPEPSILNSVLYAD